MKKFFYVAIVLIWLGETSCASENCSRNETTTKNECNFTDYESYVNCVRDRVKRQAGCNEEKEDASFSSSGAADCSECDCNYCNQNHCNTPCDSCCFSCKTRGCCYRTCHAQCTTYTCRRSCKKSCTDRVTGTNGNVTHNSTSTHLHNTTTVINLQTVVNNTNIIPVNVHNTPNITINLKDYLPTNSSSPRCCQIISPRQCTPYNQFPFIKCYHYRKHVCSNICQTGIMHAQPHQVCDERPSGPPNCYDQTIYIPQPQPRCLSTSTWPYLVCGIKRVCDGCYSEGNHCPQACNNIGPYHRPSPSWFGSSGFGSSGFGFSSPSVYPAYLGLPENQFSIGVLPENPEMVLQPQPEGGLPGNPMPPTPMYVEGNNSISANDVVQAEVIQLTNPAVALDEEAHSVSIKAIKSSVEGDAVIIIE